MFSTLQNVPVFYVVTGTMFGGTAIVWMLLLRMLDRASVSTTTTKLLQNTVNIILSFLFVIRSFLRYLNRLVTPIIDICVLSKTQHVRIEIFFKAENFSQRGYILHTSTSM